MGSVTQKVSNYVLGISQQPDEKKVPGQVVDLVNGLPDVVKQLTKRPGSHLIKDITTTSNPYGDSQTYAVDTGSNSRWFSIYATDDKQYIGQCAADGDIKIWRCSDGASIPVDYVNVPGTLKATYLDNTALADEKSSDIQVLTINETTFFVNRRKNTAILSTPNKQSPAKLNEAYIELDTISYGKQYALDIYDPTDNTTYSYHRATSIVVDDAGTFGGVTMGSGEPGDGSCHGMGRETVAGSSGTAIGSTSPPNASSGGKSNLRYEVDTRCTPQLSNSPGSTAGEDYYDAYTPFCKLQFGGEGWSTNDTHAYTSQKGVGTTITVKSHSVVTSRANIAMVRPAPTSSTNEEHVSAAGILGDLKAAIDAISGHGITATIVGNGIHLYRATPFGVTSPERNLVNVVTSEANNIAVLPRTCRHGFVVRIVNSGDDMDDYYLRFQAEGISADIAKSATYSKSGTTATITSTAHGLANGDTVFADFTSGAGGDGHYTVSNVATNTFDLAGNSHSGTISAGETCTYTPARFGEGVWEEVAAPAINIELDDDTMPLAMTFVDPCDTFTVATSAVTTGTEQININSHGWATGNAIVYTNGGGTTLAGLTSGTTYYVIKVDDNTIKVATNAANATAGTAINLTGTGNNAQTFHQIYSINGGTSRKYNNGVFQLKYPEWGQRDVGDDLTNSAPSFVGYPIQKMMFFRNRIAMLSAENVILSRVNDYLNFWVKTAMAISNADPIDLQSSSTFPTKLYDAVEAPAGLVLFSANEQFLLSSGAEALLTPETAKVSFLSSYAFNADTNPFSLGTTVGFINSTAKNGRFYEMAGINARSEPTIIEQSKIIGNLFPSNTTLSTASTENDLMVFGVDSTLHTASNEVWGYKWFEANNKRIQSAWFRWTLPNNVIYHVILDDVYYVILSDGTNYTFEKFDIKLSDNTFQIGDDPNVNRVFLDTKTEVPTGSITYDSVNDISTFALGSGYYSSRTLTAFCTTDSDARGKSYDIPTTHLDKTFAASAVDTSAETITIASHTLATGNPVTYQEGSSAVGGLTDNTVYYVIKVDDNTIKLATTKINADAGTTINLTSQGGGTHTFETPTVVLPGNWKTSTKDGASVNTGLVLGYEYEFEVELPKLYVTRAEGDKVKSETRGSLVIHRMNFDFGDVGVIDVTLQRRGRDDYTYTVESLEWDNVLASTPAVAQSYNHTIPVYDRNVNLTVKIKSNHPSPATIHAMNWEGDYSPRYYKRV